MKVIDNFLPSAYQDEIEKTFLDVGFPWYLNLATVFEDYGIFQNKNTKDGLQFTHGFMQEGKVYSNHYPLVAALPYHLTLREGVELEKIVRVKANLTVPQDGFPVAGHHAVHVDYVLSNLITCIYYVNDSDGDTVFFTGDGAHEISRVSPKKGRLVCFNGNTPHAGRPPLTTNVRCVINFNFLIKGNYEPT